MDKKIKSLITKYANNADLTNQIVVTAFLNCHRLEVISGYLVPFVIKEPNDIITDIETLSKNLSLEDVITIFELAIPEAERTTNGAVYTPKLIRDYIVKQALHSASKPLNECLCADISCGCGAFLYTLAENIHTNTQESFAYIYRHLYGVDISEISITRAKILLSLLALEYGEEIKNEDFNLFYGNSLNFNFKQKQAVQNNGGFDIIVGNPPYVRAKHLDADTKQLLPNWQTSSIGNADLYIPFFEIGLSILNADGILGYIIVNSFFKSVNARSLRQYFNSNKISLSIIDFGEQLVFKNKLAYTCITFLSKSPTNTLLYAKATIEEVKSQKSIAYNRIDYSSLDDFKGWNLNDKDILHNIFLIENAGKALGDLYVIKNGIATLANDVFIFRPTKIDEEYYYLIREGKEYSIEREICRDIIKPNILKTEADIADKAEKIIMPYDTHSVLIAEDVFIKRYPHTYAYLQSCREILNARDKGKGDYVWYAFGRTQAIAENGRKLLFPYISDIPHFVYMPQQDMMIYCGYAIYHDSESELLFLKKVLESKIFDYYMRHTSKPYSTGYYSYAKNYVKSFGLYPFSEQQKQHILSLSSKTDIDNYISALYGVTF